MVVETLVEMGRVVWWERPNILVKFPASLEVGQDRPQLPAPALNSTGGTQDVAAVLHPFLIFKTLEKIQLPVLLIQLQVL